MTDQKNTILAIVLSAIVLIGWQYFVGMPQMEKQRQEAQLKQQQQQQQQPQQPAPAARHARRSPRSRRRSPARRRCPARRGAAAGQQLTREAVLAASPRIAIETPRLQRLDRAQGRPHRRPRADAIPRDGRSEIAADRAAVAVRQPASVLRRVRLGRAAPARRSSCRTPTRSGRSRARARSASAGR